MTERLKTDTIFTKDQLRALAKRIYDGGSRLDSAVTLTAQERSALIDVIVRLDGDDPATLAKKSDYYVSGMALGALRRQETMRVLDARLRVMREQVRAIRGDNGGN